MPIGNIFASPGYSYLDDDARRICLEAMGAPFAAELGVMLARWDNVEEAG